MKRFLNFLYSDYVFIIFLVIFAGKSVTLSDTAAKCTRSCSVSDKSDNCWSQSLEYFTEDLARALDDYTGTLIYIARWRSKLKKEGEKFKHFEEEHLNKTIKELFKSGNERILPEDALYDILKLALAKARPLQEKFEDPSEVPPNFSCPVPCTYEPHIWIILFWVMLAITVLLVITISLYIILYKDSNFVKKTLI